MAIIGAGIAGASVAYQLHNEYTHLVPMEVVVFEADEQIGGLVNSTPLDGGTHGVYRFVETGATIFRGDDSCMQTAVDNAGLRRKVAEVPRRYTSVPAGVWDGESIILKRKGDLKARTRREQIRDIWYYGLSVRRLHAIVDDKLSRFRELYSENSYTDGDLLAAIRRVGLEEESKTPATQYLSDHRISSSYIHDIVEPTVRKLFGHDINELNAFSVLIAMDLSPAFELISRPRGMAELVLRLLRLSEAQLQLRTRVASITRSSHDRFQLKLSDSSRNEEKEDDQEFDIVIIAAHLRRAALGFDFGSFSNGESLPAFVERHVTYFTTPLNIRLAPAVFNVSTSDDIPDVIYTAAQRKTRVFSLESSFAPTVLEGDVVYGETLYKITSPETIPDAFIAELLGHPLRPLAEIGVKWVHRRVWPLASPLNVDGPHLDNIELTNGLFYTGVAEELLPTMEMNCRLGVKVASMIFQRLRPRQNEMYPFLFERFERRMEAQ